ncbi:hypothetical protein QJQ45_026627, partial [Haematococcus lacustris]
SYDRDVSAALNIRRCAVGPGPRPTELYYWEGRPAMPKPGQPGQEWVYLRDQALLRNSKRASSQMACPYEAVLTTAVSRCPFLSAVGEEQGLAYARAIAVNPVVPAAHTAGLRRPVLEDLTDFASSFRLFHGPGGVVPLVRYVEQPAAPAQPMCQPEQRSSQCSEAEPKKLTTVARHPLRHSALATISLSGFGNGFLDFGAIMRALQHHAKPAQHRRQGPEVSKPKPRAGPAPSQGDVGQSSGQCPMRKMLGPLAPVVFNPAGHLQCPQVIIQARAILAATKPVRHLRPQALPVKLLAVGVASAAVNVPFGMWREHCEKFGVHWFIAVHASIPFIAMLRKAVIMPKYAILFTIATAIAGQAVGARLERKRLQPRSARLVTSPAAVCPLAATSAHSSKAGAGGALLHGAKLGVWGSQKQRQRKQLLDAPLLCGVQLGRSRLRQAELVGHSGAALAALPHMRIPVLGAA